MYGPFDYGLVFHPLFCMVLISGSFGMLACEGLNAEFVVAIYEFNELDCKCRRG